MPDNFIRYQKGLKLEHLFPSKSDNTCACGCGKKLTGRQKRWASEECSERAYEIFSIYKGNSNSIRKALFKIEQGFCRNCGVYSTKWQADHIIPVFLGGGYSALNNFQTLCPDCHKEKTKYQIASHLNTISSQAASTADMVRLKALEEQL